MVLSSHLKHSLVSKRIYFMFCDFEVELKSNDLISLAEEFSRQYKLRNYVVLVGSFSQIYSDSTKESRNILKVCILDKVCIFKSVDKNGIVREFSAIQKKSSG